MATLTVSQDSKRKINVEIDLNQWEKLADVFGFYQSGFLKTLKGSIKESKQGKVRKIKSLSDLEQ